MSALEQLPRVFVTAHHVYIVWPECPHGLHPAVTSLGTYLDDVFGWAPVPEGAVELVPAERAESP